MKRGADGVRGPVHFRAECSFYPFSGISTALGKKSVEWICIHPFLKEVCSKIADAFHKKMSTRFVRPRGKGAGAGKRGPPKGGGASSPDAKAGKTDIIGPGNPAGKVPVAPITGTDDI